MWSDALTADGWSGAFLPMAFGRGARGEDDAVHAGALPDLADVVANPLTGAGPFGPGLDDWLRRLAGQRLVLGVRLHAVLLAVAMGVPTVAIAYERKVHDAFVDLGLGRYVVGTTVDPAPCTARRWRRPSDTDGFAAGGAAARRPGRGRASGSSRGGGERVRVLLLTPFAPHVDHDHAAADTLVKLVPRLAARTELFVYSPQVTAAAEHDGYTLLPGAAPAGPSTDRLGVRPGVAAPGLAAARPPARRPG